ncbi:tyrosine-type recombinase/integrase [Halomicroarcula sp. GCM10025324]|uniref:tyrosine-type recombinase/integrase n=1 Tax=Haloarcula TaxID=2237 RepID=UPI0023E8285F|nr:tyrosine-type recombinase/integrase [Halomicroarcula sp. ZS-22-S1]
MTGFNRERLDTLPQEYVDLIREFETYKNDTGKQSGTVQTYLVRVTDFFEWLVNHGNTPPVDDLNDRHAIRYTRWAESHYSAATYRSRIITTKNMFEVVETLNGSIWKRPEAGLPDSQEVRDSNKHGREIDITDMSKFFMSIRDPLWHAFFLTLLKLLVRNGEATNIRLSEVHIDDPDIYQLYDDLDITYCSTVANSPDSIYIPSDREGNKRRSSTRIPIDSELKAALIRWLAVRPTTEASLSDPQTLFVSLGDNWGQPLSPSSVGIAFAELAPESWRSGDDPFTPHNFRHWSNRKLRGKITDDLLSYLRGDAEDMLAHYDDLIAEYDERVRKPYVRHIPSIYL